MLGRHDQDLPWLESVVRAAGGPVLELACGTGRVTVPLAHRTGLAVVGLDIDDSMLDGARRRGAGIVVRADMAHFAFAPRFAVVAVPYNSIQLLDANRRASCVRSARGALRAGGVLALECADFQRSVTVTEVDETELATDGTVTMHGSVRHDLDRRCSHYRRRFVLGTDMDEEVEDVTTIWSLTADDVASLVESAGMTVAELESDGMRTRCIATLRA